MPVTIDLEYLIDFLNELRAAGFDVSTQRYIAAQDLLIALAANGNLPEDPRSLRTLLAPIVCSSPREQENFHRLRKQIGPLRLYGIFSSSIQFRIRLGRFRNPKRGHKRKHALAA